MTPFSLLRYSTETVSRQSLEASIHILVLYFLTQLYSQYANGFAILYIILTCSFLAVLLTFWLSLLDEVRLSPPSSSVRAATERRKRIYWLYGPKLVIVGCIWSILVSTFVFIRLERKGDPTYEGLDDWVLRDA